MNPILEKANTLANWIVAFTVQKFVSFRKLPATCISDYERSWFADYSGAALSICQLEDAKKDSLCRLAWTSFAHYTVGKEAICVSRMKSTKWHWIPRLLALAGIAVIARFPWVADEVVSFLLECMCLFYQKLSSKNCLWHYMTLNETKGRLSDQNFIWILIHMRIVNYVAGHHDTDW